MASHVNPKPVARQPGSQPRKSRAPIHNPFDKFSQNEFESWIGHLKGSLQRALGQEPEAEFRSGESVKDVRNGDDDHNKPSAVSQKDRKTVEESDMDDTFALVRARQSKGKERDPREGPGLGADRSQPIEIDSSSEGHTESDTDASASPEIAYSDEEQKEYDPFEVSESGSHERQLGEDDQREERLAHQDKDTGSNDGLYDPQFLDGGPTFDVLSDEDMLEGDQAEFETEGGEFDREALSGSIPQIRRREGTPENCYDTEMNEEDFPPDEVISQPLDLQDPWSGPRTFAEDYYAGGDARIDAFDPHNITPETPNYLDDNKFVTLAGERITSEHPATLTAVDQGVDNLWASSVSDLGYITEPQAERSVDSKSNILTPLHNMSDPSSTSETGQLQQSIDLQTRPASAMHGDWSWGPAFPSNILVASDHLQDIDSVVESQESSSEAPLPDFGELPNIVQETETLQNVVYPGNVYASVDSSVDSMPDIRISGDFLDDRSLPMNTTNLTYRNSSETMIVDDHNISSVNLTSSEMLFIEPDQEFSERKEEAIDFTDYVSEETSPGTILPEAAISRIAPSRNTNDADVAPGVPQSGWGPSLSQSKTVDKSSNPEAQISSPPKDLVQSVPVLTFSEEPKEPPEEPLKEPTPSYQRHFNTGFPMPVSANPAVHDPTSIPVTPVLPLSRATSPTSKFDGQATSPLAQPATVPGSPGIPNAVLKLLRGHITSSDAGESGLFTPRHGDMSIAASIDSGAGSDAGDHADSAFEDNPEVAPDEKISSSQVTTTAPTSSLVGLTAHHHTGEDMDRETKESTIDKRATPIEGSDFGQVDFSNDAEDPQKHSLPPNHMEDSLELDYPRSGSERLDDPQVSSLETSPPVTAEEDLVDENSPSVQSMDDAEVHVNMEPSSNYGDISTKLDAAEETDPFKLMGNDSTVAPGAVDDEIESDIGLDPNVSSPGCEEASATEVHSEDACSEEAILPSAESHHMELGSAPSKQKVKTSSTVVDESLQNNSPVADNLSATVPRQLKRKRQKTKAAVLARLRLVKDGDWDMGSAQSMDASESSSSGSSASQASKMLVTQNQTASRASSVISNDTSSDSSLDMPSSPVRGTSPLPPDHSRPIHHYHHHRPNGPMEPTQQKRGVLPATPRPSTIDPTPSLNSSPITRSNCRFHKISLPQENEESRAFFIVPGCSLTNRKLMKEEEIDDHGAATKEEYDHDAIDQVETLDLDPYLLGILRQLVGVELSHQNEIRYLPQSGLKGKRKRSHRQSALKRKTRPRLSSNLVRRPSEDLNASSSLRNSTRVKSSPISPHPGAPVSTASTSTAGSRAIRSQPDSFPTNSSSERDQTEEEQATQNTRISRRKKKKGAVPLQLSAADGKALSGQPNSLGRRRSKRLGMDASAYKPGEDEDVSDGSEPSNRRLKRSGKRGEKRIRTSEQGIDEEVEGSSIVVKRTRI